MLPLTSGLLEKVCQHGITDGKKETKRRRTNKRDEALRCFTESCRYCTGNGPRDGDGDFNGEKARWGPRGKGIRAAFKEV